MAMATSSPPQSQAQANDPPALPREVIDPHHHFIDTAGTPFQTFLRSVAGSDVSCLPEDYRRDVVEPLADAGVKLAGSVHVEAMPDSGVEEVAWVEGMRAGGRCDFVGAYVASCDLTRDDVDDELRRLEDASGGRLRGIRWIVDCVGKFDGGRTATHAATLRHDGEDRLKSPEFERGLALLGGRGLSFDLQCAPAQLAETAPGLFARHPDLRVCLDHLGKPRRVLGDDLLDDGRTVNPNAVPDEAELETWRRGMRAMAALPNVYVKISMMGYAVPGWVRTETRRAALRSIVRETVDTFGADRCMVAWNWHVNGAVSDADGASGVGPDAVELLRSFAGFFEGYTEGQREMLFAGTAREFYRLK